jgi:hypothetical protein
MNVQDEPLDAEALATLAHLTAQNANELTKLDKLAIGGSSNMRGLQYDPKELIKNNFLPRVQRNGATPVPANMSHAPQPRPQFVPPPPPPQQLVPPPPQPVQVQAQSPLSDAQTSLLIEKILRLERMLERAIEGQDRLQNTLDKSLNKLLQKKLKDLKITFKDDDCDSQQE